MNTIYGKVISGPEELYTLKGEPLYKVTLEVAGKHPFEVIMYKNAIPDKMPEWAAFTGNIVHFKRKNKLQTFFRAVEVQTAPEGESSTKVTVEGEFQEVSKLRVDPKTGTEHISGIIQFSSLYNAKCIAHFAATGRTARFIDLLPTKERSYVFSGIFRNRSGRYELIIKEVKE